MAKEIIFHALIDLIILAILIYVFKANKRFFVASLLVLLLIILIFPEFLLPSFIWEYLLED